MNSEGHQLHKAHLVVRCPQTWCPQTVEVPCWVWGRRQLQILPLPTVIPWYQESHSPSKLEVGENLETFDAKRALQQGLFVGFKQYAWREPEPSFRTHPPQLFSSSGVWLPRLFICTQLSLKIISDYLPVQSLKQVDQLLLCFTSGYPSKGRERESACNGLPGSKTPFWATESHISESIDHSAVCVSSRPWSCLQPCKIITVLMSVR